MILSGRSTALLTNVPNKSKVGKESLNSIDDFLGIYGSPEFEYRIIGTKFRGNLPDSVEVTIRVTGMNCKSGR